MLPGRLDREDPGSIKALRFPEVSSSSAFMNSMASETMLRDEKLEDAAAALSAASKKVAPFLRGNMRKPVAASDASARAAAATISPEGRQLQESSRRESLGFPAPPLLQEYVQDVRNEMRNGPRMDLVSPNGQHPFRPGLLGPDTRLPTPEREFPFSASTGPQASSFPMQTYERDLRATVGPMAPSPVSQPVFQSQRGRISQRVQGALRAHAALHSEGTVPVAPGTAPAGGTLPMPAMVNGASEHGQHGRHGQLRQAKEVIASLDTCGDPTVMERWMHHLEESVHPMKEAEKIMGMLRSLVRQGFCAGTADQAVQKRSQVMRGPVPPRLQDVTESSGQWPALQTSSPHGPPVQTSSPHGSLSRGILATAPNTQAGRDGQVAGTAQAQRNMHAIARNLVDKGLLDPRSIPNGLSEIPANDADMLSMLRHLKEVGESSRCSS